MARSERSSRTCLAASSRTLGLGYRFAAAFTGGPVVSATSASDKGQESMSPSLPLASIHGGDGYRRVSDR